jgi:hypothetical protein
VVDSEKAILGKSVGAESEAAATETAMNDCTSQGGTTCHVLASLKNQCVAMVVGSKYLTATFGPTKLQAEAAGVKECEDHPDTKCQTYFSACSPPVLIN